jgi:hypothetical protein
MPLVQNRNVAKGNKAHSDIRLRSVTPTYTRFIPRPMNALGQGGFGTFAGHLSAADKFSGA